MTYIYPYSTVVVRLSCVNNFTLLSSSLKTTRLIDTIFGVRHLSRLRGIYIIIIITTPSPGPYWRGQITKKGQHFFSTHTYSKKTTKGMILMSKKPSTRIVKLKAFRLRAEALEQANMTIE